MISARQGTSFEPATFHRRANVFPANLIASNDLAENFWFILIAKMHFEYFCPLIYFVGVQTDVFKRRWRKIFNFQWYECKKTSTI
jgi:hypothetical protein